MRNALFHCNKFRREGACLDSLLSFARPFHWCSVYENDITGVRFSSLRISSVRCMNISASHQEFAANLRHLVGHELFCVLITIFAFFNQTQQTETLDLFAATVSASHLSKGIDALSAPCVIL